MSDSAKCVYVHFHFGFATDVKICYVVVYVTSAVVVNVHIVIGTMDGCNGALQHVNVFNVLVGINNDAAGHLIQGQVCKLAVNVKIVKFRGTFTTDNDKGISLLQIPPQEIQITVFTVLIPGAKHLYAPFVHGGNPFYREGVGSGGLYFRSSQTGQQHHQGNGQERCQYSIDFFHLKSSFSFLIIKSN